jgi:type IV pilus assembly protein PilC
MADEKNQNILDRDLFDLPVFRRLKQRWFLWRMRGERGNLTRSLLFLDLSEAVRMKMPLDEALELIAQAQDPWSIPFWLGRGFAWTSFWYPAFVDPERGVKRVAQGLLPWVRQGLSLSQAMTRLGRAFSRQDILIVEMGEKAGILPQALKRLGEYRQTDMRLERLKAHLVYPVMIVTLASGIIAFMLTIIIPKLQDIYNQLGGDLPQATQSLINASYLAMHFAPMAFLFIVILFLGLFLLNSLVSRISGVPLSSYLPIFGGLYRTIREGRWMAALALGLEAGVRPDTAIEQAGGVSGGALEKRSRQAARLVGMGGAIGEACIRCNVLEGWINHRLQLIDWRGNYIQSLREIVEDANRRVVRSVESFGQRLEIVAIIVVGVFVAFTVIGLYLPLFYISKVMLAGM